MDVFDGTTYDCIPGFVGSSTSIFCVPTKFYCGLGATGIVPADATVGCVDTTKLCDGFNDCDNFGDEVNCDSRNSNTCTGE